ncbi:MAG: hypothetical protein ACI3YK_04050 [Eubacteriales bacterium]
MRFKKMNPVQNPQNLTNPRFALQNKLNISRGNLMLVILFTVINCALLIGGSTTYFLFSAIVPYALIATSQYLTGFAPLEAYEGEYAFEFLPAMVFYVVIAVAAVIVLCYLVCWILAKKHAFAAFLTALILFGIDSLLLFLDTVLGGSIDLSVLIDVAAHVWVIYYLILGLSASVKLKKLPPEAEVPSYEGNPEIGVNPDFAADSRNALTGEDPDYAESSSEQIPPAEVGAEGTDESESVEDGGSSDENQ